MLQELETCKLWMLNTYLISLHCLPMPFIRTNTEHLSVGLRSNKVEDEPVLLELMNEVAARIPSKWRDVGIQLHLNPDHLDGIAVSVSSSHDRFCSVFTLWKKQLLPPYKWSTVLQALKSPSVNESRLAEELKNKLRVTV